MKCIILLLILFVSQSLQGQNRKIKMNARNISLRNALAYIYKASGHPYTADPEDLKYCIPINIIMEDSMDYEQVLDICFKDQPLTYHIINGAIYVEARDVHGRVQNENKEPLEGITVTPEDASQSTVTDKNGAFTLYRSATQPYVVFTSVNMQTDTLYIAGRTSLSITMKRKVTESPNVTVTVSTGMEDIPKERAAGSFSNVDNDQLNQRVAGGLLNRLEWQATGVMLTRNRVKTTNQPAFTIRGRSTIFSNTAPLIIVDNFPYGTEINDINPNDVESISINKDAAATSIWGGAAGNGVMVVVLKKGRYRQKPVLSFTANSLYTLQQDPWYQSQTGSNDYVELERSLFNKGFYDAQLNAKYSLLSPVVELLYKQRLQQLSAPAVNAALNELAGHDIRADYNRWYYQPDILQQYAFNISGGTPRSHYYFSAGYDHNQLSQAKAWHNRFTASTRLTVKPLKRLELTTVIALLKTTTHNDMPLPRVLYPYSQLADAHGNYLTVPMDWRQSWKEGLPAGITDNWNYQPLAELDRENYKVSALNLRIKFAANYRLWERVDINIACQYHLENAQNNQEQAAQSYYARNLSNIFTEVVNGIPVNHIPRGNILDQLKHNYEALNTRLQINYNDVFTNDFELSSIAGGEIRSVKTDSAINTFYGYRDGQWKNEQMDFKALHPLFYNTSLRAAIPDNKFNSAYYDRYASLYANAALTWRQRYTLSVSGRMDQSNLLGAGTNQKVIPLWSAGFNWILSEEKFYQLPWLSLLKLRVNYGCNGNINKNATAYLTGRRNPTTAGGWPTSSLISPPNDDLRWEKINTFNLGLDFHLFHKRIQGSIESYARWSQFLLGDTPLESTTGFTMYRGNTAALFARGLELTLETQHTTSKLAWNTLLLLSYSTHKVTRYLQPFTEASAYTNPGRIAPRVEYPLDALYSYPWGGLQHNTGDPQGYLQEKLSTQYPDILKADPASLDYKGRTTPPLFGSLQNSIRTGAFTFSCMITGKFKYVFQKPVLSYTDLFTYKTKGHSDYANRWQIPGDETKTNVPSIPSSSNPWRDEFYANASVNVEKADHIRLQQLQISYAISSQLAKTLHASDGSISISAYNLGILWKATDTDIDPDYVNELPIPMSLAVSLKIDF